MRESDIETYLVHQVKANGGATRKLRWIGRRHAPDRVILLNGVHFVECKAPGEKLRKGQQQEADILRYYGVSVWEVSKLEEVDNFIKEIMK